MLLLDEPFAGLGAGEIEPLAGLIRKLHRSEGLTILIIEHKLREFMQLVERVIAMDFGEIIAIGDPSAIVRHPRVVEAYMGNADLALTKHRTDRSRRWRCLKSRTWRSATVMPSRSTAFP